MNHQSCLYCSKKSFNDYPFCKRHAKKRLDINEYNNLSDELKNKICKSIIKSGKNKGLLCSKLCKNSICIIHKRIENGTCYVKYCNNIADSKSDLCKYHLKNKTCRCNCKRHFYNIFVPRTFSIPDDIIYYIYSFQDINNKKTMQFLSKKFWNLYDNIFKLPYQINLGEKLLVNKLNNMLGQFELLTDLNDQINIAKLIFKLICQNLYFVKKYEKFRVITLQKIEDFEEYFYNKFYHDAIIEGIKLI